MKHPWKLLLTCLILFCITFIYFSCQKEISPGKGRQSLKIYLTDDPVPFDAVNVDIRQVAIKVVPDTCSTRQHDDGDDDNQGDDDHDDDLHDLSCAVWDTLSITPGVYNLLDLSNGFDTLLASGNIPAGKIVRIRITLGDNNSVTVDSVSYPLQLYNNIHEVTLSVNHDEDVEEIRTGNLQMFLDFDVSKSIVRIENNRFVLRSRIIIFVPSRTGAIEGRVVPGQAKAIIAAYTGTDTLVAIPHDDGEFKIRGITGRSANLFINATANGYRDTTISNVAISPGHETDIGTIRLRQ